MRDFSHTKRIVVKIGTNILTRNAAVDTVYFRRIARQISGLRDQGRQVVIVTSGAIGMGAGSLSLSKGLASTKMRQACAAIGQPLLMQQYRLSFAARGMTVAQVLLTAEVLNNRRTYLNLRNSIETLLKLSVVPILNENDSVSTEEIGSTFGDNDKLSALVASKLDADLLIILSDIDALYNKDPRRHPDAVPIKTVHRITDQIVQSASGPATPFATGGMKTKLAAARIASDAGCRVVLAHGRARDVLTRIIAGSPVGTLFIPRRQLGNRARWILNSRPAGSIVIDRGAMDALRQRKSLLPSGVVSVKGSFPAGSVVMLNDHAKAVVSLSSEELKTIAGGHSSQIRKLLGQSRRDVVAVPEDIVTLDY